jgi:putative radical SAM enzyme (TIGR03279 family)
MTGGLVKAITAGSVAAAAGLRPGDEVVAINDRRLRDVIDAQFFAAEDDVTFALVRDGAPLEAHAARESGQELGIEFEHPTFDIDIRRCNNLCPFCFVLQNAPKMRRTLYIKDDDYRYSFLFGHFVTLTNLIQEDWDRLAEQRLSPLYVSVHATDLDMRRRCLRNPTAPDALEQLRWLAAHGIQAHTQLVITPGLNDGAYVEQSVRELAALWPSVQSVSVVPVGLTKHHKYGHRAHNAQECRSMVERVNAWQTEFMARFDRRFVYATDEWYLVGGMPLPPKRDYDGLALRENGLGMVREFLNEWARVKRKELPAFAASNASRAYDGAILATATLFAPTLARAGAELSRATGVPVATLPILNEKLGDGITVAGLLMGEDIIRQVRAARAGNGSAARMKNPVLVLPRITFDHPQGVALDDIGPLEIARALNMPIALADWMGDVIDALNGENKLSFRPDENALELPIIREGGWAVEKYL